MSDVDHEATGQLWAWGANHLGQAGQGPGPDLAAPTPVAGLPPVKAASVNAVAMLALDGAGGVWSWGWNQSGLAGRVAEGEPLIWLTTALRKRGHKLQPDAGAAYRCLAPRLIAGLPPMQQALLANDQGFALDGAGRVWAWGGQPEFDLVGQEKPARPPRVMGGLEGIRQVSAAPDGLAAYARDEAGRVWSWGNGMDGELGRGKRRHDPVPGLVEGLGPVRSVHAGAFSCLALLHDGTVWGWGHSQDQIGFHPASNKTLRVLAPVRVEGPSGIERIWFTGRLAIFRNAAGETWVSGAGIGLLDPERAGEEMRAPERYPALDGFSRFALGDDHGFAITATGDVHAFGRGESGALGDGSLDEDVQKGLTRVTLAGRPLAMAAFSRHSFAIV